MNLGVACNKNLTLSGSFDSSKDRIYVTFEKEPNLNTINPHSYVIILRHKKENLNMIGSEFLLEFAEVFAGCKDWIYCMLF